jgi:glycosyltransferase involved in cell wall biosynthesis
MKRLDVLLVFRDARPAAGGLSINIRDLANGLSEQGHGVEVATVRAQEPRAPGAYEFINEVGVVELPPLSRGGLALSYGLAPGVGRVVKRDPKRIVHVFSCVPAYVHLAAMAAARRAGTPLVWTPMMHPARQAVWSEYGLRGRAMRFFDAVVPRIARFPHVVVASTEGEAEQFKRLGARRVEVLPPGVRDATVIPDAEAASLRRRFGIGEQPLVVTVVRRLERRKGLPFCIESFRLLRRQMPQARLMIVGLEDLGGVDVPEGVILTGRLSDSDLARAYRAANVVFVPSSYEAFSMIVVEAWQQARPVVVTDGVGLAESVRKGGGRVVPFDDHRAAADALREFLADPVLSEQAGQEGRDTVQERFLMRNLLANMQLLYQEIRDGEPESSSSNGSAWVNQ